MPTGRWRGPVECATTPPNELFNLTFAPVTVLARQKSPPKRRKALLSDHSLPPALGGPDPVPVNWAPPAGLIRARADHDLEVLYDPS